MAKYITGLIGLTDANEGDGLWSTFLPFFFYVCSMVDMAYSATYDQLLLF